MAAGKYLYWFDSKGNIIDALSGVVGEGWAVSGTARIAPCPDGGITLAAESTVVRIDALRNVLWSRTLSPIKGGALYFWITSVRATGTDEYLLEGFLEKSGAHADGPVRNELFAFLMDNTGAVRWQKNLYWKSQGVLFDNTSAIPLAGGGYVIHRNGLSGRSENLVGLDARGKYAWQASGGEDHITLSFNAGSQVAPASDGGLFVVSGSPGDGVSFRVYRMSPSHGTCTGFSSPSGWSWVRTPSECSIARSRLSV